MSNSNNKELKYTEKQYQKYCDYMILIANADDVMKGFGFHEELNEWLKKENLSEFVINQMDKRMEKEFEEEMEAERKN
jgi:hypothetical protein